METSHIERHLSKRVAEYYKRNGSCGYGSDDEALIGTCEMLDEAWGECNGYGTDDDDVYEVSDRAGKLQLEVDRMMEEKEKKISKLGVGKIKVLRNKK